MLCSCLLAHASGRTLRLDYIFSGNSDSAAISLHGMSSSEGWFGRSVNMQSLPVEGNGQIRLFDAGTDSLIYAYSFSTLFQEWAATPEAKVVTRAFENTFLVPMPEAPARVEITLTDMRGQVNCRFSHPVDPDDILIRSVRTSDIRARYIVRSGDPAEKIDVVILAEGYTRAERRLFMRDAADAVDAILSHEPFKSCRDRFNFLAVASDSRDSGVSVPREGQWKRTAVNSNFDTFYSARYLTCGDIFRLHDILGGLPYEHVIILANTGTYGGGGIYNSYTLTTAHHEKFRPVVVHEFGHSFGALADEYDYDSGEDPYYFPDVEPWEKNITTKADFHSKWEDMMGQDGVTLVEGAGYQARGVWRPAPDCRMRTNSAAGFCPVCRRAITGMIEFNTVEASSGK